MKFKPPNRYEVPGNEDYEPGSNNQVLKNYLGIKVKADVDLIEAQELKRTELELIKLFDKNHKFTVDDICNIHELWLGDIYPIAGNYRTVTMSKDDFLFANPTMIPKLMGDFESKFLNNYTPCHCEAPNTLAYALGIVHVEFILIHPFREGNGRIARLLAILMALQSENPPLNFSFIDQTINPSGFKDYISAIHAGLDKNYAPIQNIFEELIRKSVW